MDITSIKLHFSSTPEFSLYRTRVNHRGVIRSLEALRGKGRSGLSSFHWTKAVKALSVLLVQEACSRRNSLETHSVLEGGRGSLASSLDYALSKKPAWLLDMFGTDSHGEPLALRYFPRNNSGRRSGPQVLVGVSQSFKKIGIEIHVDDQMLVSGNDFEQCLISLGITQRQNKSSLSRNGDLDTSTLGSSGNILAQLDTTLVRYLISDPEILSTIPRGLETRIFRNSTGELVGVWNSNFQHFIIEQRVLGPCPQPFGEGPWKWEIYSLFRREVQRMLFSVDPSNHKALAMTMSQICRDQVHRKLATKKTAKLAFSTAPNAMSSYLGVHVKSENYYSLLRNTERIDIGISPAQPASIVILLYLQIIKGLNINPVIRFANGSELIHQMDTNNCSRPLAGCVLSSSAAAIAMGRGPKYPYRPFFPMPAISQRVFGSYNSTEGERGLDAGTYLIMLDPPSTLSVHLDRLIERQAIHKHNIGRDHMEASDIITRMHKGDPDLRAIIAFPHYDFHRMFANCKYLDTGHEMAMVPEALLFLHENTNARPEILRALEFALREAWLELRQSEELRNFVVDILLQHRQYLNFLSRCAGLHRFAFDVQTGTTALAEDLYHQSFVSNI